MKRRGFTISMALAGLVPGAYATPATEQSGSSQQKATAVPSYKVLGLGRIENGRSAAFALNAQREAAGSVHFNIQGDYRPALFIPGEIPKPIYTDGPGEATGINARTEIAGWFRQGSFTQAFRWWHEQVTTLPSLGGGNSHAAGINNRSDRTYAERLQLAPKSRFSALLQTCAIRTDGFFSSCFM